MTFITGKHLSRRTLLQGIGGAIALPLLDAMRPAFAGPDERKAGSTNRRRLCPQRIVMNEWTPKDAGKEYTFTRILKPLEPFRNDITLVSGLTNNAANKGKRRWTCKGVRKLPSGTPPKYTAGADVRAGTRSIR